MASDDTGADCNVVDTVAFSPDGGTLGTGGWTKGALLRTQRDRHPDRETTARATPSPSAPSRQVG
ncbi:hypothetical protein [Streptomyces mirabilis]